MDRFGNAPVFNAVLSGLDSRRSMVVARELLIALIILFGFLLAGIVIM
jgi:multiple antibiotic resistance protein